VVSPKQGGLGRAWLAAVTLHINLLEGRLGYLPGPWDILWSLSVEEMFYLFSPIVCILLAGRKLLDREEPRLIRPLANWNYRWLRSANRLGLHDCTFPQQ
jgi:peptidoglycan/LPS O-acetylase OafA/YrhL